MSVKNVIKNRAFVEVDGNDNRHKTLQKGMNDRFPTSPASGADVIFVCKTHEEVLNAANEAHNAGYRITVRSGGHCYEGFVSEKIRSERLAIIDLGEMRGFDYQQSDTELGIASLYQESKTYKYAAYTGNQNWDGYVSMYKQTGKTIPGGSCYSVGVGGHFSGGGYGLLSRLHGCVVDWVKGVDIIVYDPETQSFKGRHVHDESTLQVDKDLFTACLGAGGGNFGIIIRYYFNELPPAPQKAYWTTISWNWSDFESEEQFGTFLKAYYGWFKDNDSYATSTDPRLNNGGLFTLLKLNHERFNPIVLAIQYTNGVTGLVGGENDEPLKAFLQHMSDNAPTPPQHFEGYCYPNIIPVRRGLHRRVFDINNLIEDSWLAITMYINGSGPTLRGKYKSTYQKGDFTDAAVKGYWDSLRKEGDIGGDLPTEAAECVFQIDSYGGAINEKGVGLTCVPQRSSILKTQHQVYWRNEPTVEIDSKVADEEYIQWIRRAYESIHSDKPGKRPSQDGGDYEGCYINYPDIDMLVDENGAPSEDWLRLYFSDDGANMELVNRLRSLKRNIDPENIFNHAMSIPV